jgi:hypothetical protein
MYHRLHGQTSCYIFPEECLHGGSDVHGWRTGVLPWHFAWLVNPVFAAIALS